MAERPAPGEDAPHVSAQVVAAWGALQARALQDGLRGQDQAFFRALAELQSVRDFVGPPGSSGAHILGNPSTKHGEIAEALTVGLRNARALIDGQAPTARLASEGAERIANWDYSLAGTQVQSKYYNGLRNTLDGILEHQRKYPGFHDGRRYHIPKDQFEQLVQLKETGELGGRRVGAILQKLADLESQTGVDVRRHIQPGEGSYAEVTGGNIHKTLDGRELALGQRSADHKRDLHEAHGPSPGHAAQAAAMGGAMGGVMGTMQAIWVKHRSGKRLFAGDYNAEDWRDIGLKAASGTAMGAVSGAAVYGLSGSGVLAAPLAGSLVSGVFGVASVTRERLAGRISEAQAVDLSLMAASDAAFVGLSTMAGQALIPIPMLGALVGGVAGRVACFGLREGMSERERQLREALEGYQRAVDQQLDAQWRAFLRGLDAVYGSVDRLIEYTFDPQRNLRLRLGDSVQLATQLGVAPRDILRDTDALDAFMRA